MTNLKRDAMAYSNALPFFREMRNCRDMLTTQQLKTLKGQALARFRRVEGPFEDHTEGLRG